MYQLGFYVPGSHLDAVKSALFDKGAGRIGDYEACCWQVLGEGQFCPTAGSQPFIGAHNQLEKLDEWKVEMVCEDHLIKDVVATLKTIHPYEEVAYTVYRLVDL